VARKRFSTLSDLKAPAPTPVPAPTPAPRELSWSEWFDGCGSPGKPCTHCGREGNCRCSE
jgi:hypothetical protein